MASYLWAPDCNHLLFDSNGRLWLYDLKNGTGVQVAFTDMASGDDPKFSPNGETLSFVRDHDLAVVRLREPGSPMSLVGRNSRRWHYQWRSGLGVRRRAGRAQQLLLVARFEEHRLPADE